MNWADWVMIALVVCSCIAGILRGLLREIVSLVTWLAAFWLAWNYAPLLEPHLGGALSNDNVRAWAARVLIFLAVLLVGALVGLIVSQVARLALFSGTDRFLGGLFGIVRAVVTIGVLVILCHAVRLEGEPWWHRSLLVPYAERAANVLRGLVGERKVQVGSPLTTER